MVSPGVRDSVNTGVKKMGTIRTQRENKSENVKNNAASANSVPELRAEVSKLAEAVQRLEIVVERIIGKPIEGEEIGS